MVTTAFRSMKFGFAAALIGATAALSLGAGCSGVTSATLCQQICECQGCSASETQECEATFEKAQKLSGDQACDSAYAAYTSCIADNLECVDDKVDVEACATELKSLNTCAKATPIVTPAGGGACEAYKQKVKDCCDKFTDPQSSELCNAIVDGIDTTNTPQEVCKAAISAYMCTAN